MSLHDVSSFAVRTLPLAAGACLMAMVGFAITAIWQRAQWRRWLKLSALSLAGFFACALCGYAIIFFVELPRMAAEQRQAMEASSRQAKETSTIAQVGDTVPDVELKRVDGSTARLADLRGKVVLLTFFATWCGPCVQELPEIEKLWNAYKGRADFALFAVAREEDVATVQEFARAQNLTLPMASDLDRAVYSRFAMQFIPRLYLIDRDGKIVHATVGYQETEFAEMRDELSELLNP